MYKQSLLRKISLFCAILSVILGIWSILAIIYIVTETKFVFNFLSLLFVILPTLAVPAVFGILAFVIRLLSDELADETSGILTEIKELKKQIMELQK